MYILLEVTLPKKVAIALDEIDLVRDAGRNKLNPPFT
jgi:hypothetical protein